MSLLLFLKPTKGGDVDTHDGFGGEEQKKQQYFEVEVIRKPKRTKKVKAKETTKEVAESLESLVPALNTLPTPLPQTNEGLLLLLDGLQAELNSLREQARLKNVLNLLAEEQEKLRQIKVVELERGKILEEIDETILLLLFGET